MKVLQINWEDAGVFSVIDSDKVDQDTLQLVYEGTLDLIKFENGNFYRATLSLEDVPDDKDDKNSDTHEEYKINGWELLK